MSAFFRGFASAYLLGSLIQYHLDQPVGALHSVAVAIAGALLSLAFRPKQEPNNG